MSPNEAAAAATELAERLQKLAQLELRPTTNAIAILEHHAEALSLVEALGAFLLVMDVPA